MKKIIVFIGLLITFISSLTIFGLSLISFCIYDFYSTKIYHHNVLSIMLFITSSYSALKSLKSLNKDLETKF